MSRFYVPIAKVDAETRMVYGYASTEARDDQGEIITRTALQGALDDYMRFANIREMHQMSAVGVAKEANVDDKGLFVGAKVIDPLAWEKVTSGVYKGFSIGGRVKERNPSDRSIITGLNLTEISLVDRPANPEAVFDCWKAASLRDPVRDGKGWSCGEPSHRHHVKSAAAACIRKSAAALDDPDAAGAGQGDNTMADTAMAAALKAAGVTTDTPAQPDQTVSQDDGSGVEQVWKASDGATFKTKAEAERHSLAVAAAAAASAAAAPATAALDRLEGALAKREVPDPAKKAGDGSEPYGDVAYADPGYRDGKKRYPIDTEEHIRAAWSYIHQKRNADKYTEEQVAHIKAKIVAAWKAKIDKDGPPQADDSKKAAVVVLAKSLWDVGRIASIIQELRWIVEGLKMEAAMEGDQSEAAKELEEICGRTCAFLVDLAREETGEIMEGTEVPPEDIGLASGLGADGFARLAVLLPDDHAAKAIFAGLVEKARMSSHDQAMIDLAAHAGRVVAAMPGLSAAAVEHINLGVAELQAAGASAALHSGVYDSGRYGETSTPQVTPPAQEYHGQNATTDTGRNPTHRAPRVNASGSGIGIDHVAAAAAIATLAKRSAGHRAILNVAHDAINAAAGMPLCEAAKAGGHSAEIMAHLRGAHDHFVKAGAMCGEEVGQGTEFDTAKAAENEALRKTIADIGTRQNDLADRIEKALAGKDAEIETLKKRIEEIAAQPLPPKAAARDIEIPPGLHRVSKGADGAALPAASLDDAAVIKHLNGLSEEDRTLLLIKAAQNDPRSRFTPGAPRA